MDRRQNVIITNICLVYKDDMILVQERTKKDWPGLTFPGGHVEKDENFHDSVIREVYEETGLKLLHPILCGIEEFKLLKDEERHIILYYKCNEFEGELKDSKEGHVFWISREDFAKADLSLDLDRMLKIMEDDELSELIYYRKDSEWQSKIV